VLKREKPDRPVLFEYFMNGDLFSHVTGKSFSTLPDNLEKIKVIIEFFHATGYDYATIPSRYFDALQFENADHEKKSTISQNEGFVITDRASFEAYHWPEGDKGNFDLLVEASNFLNPGMKFIISGPGGLLENVISLVGFERLCFMIFEDEQLAKDIFDEVGSRLLMFYDKCSTIAPVGALIVNDDWGFKTQTMLSPDTLRQFVFPWQKKIVEVIHSNGKYAILHSCGNLAEVMDDIIEDMKFDAKHSYEDVITPVEEAYDLWHERIAIMGGMDMDFMVRSTEDEIKFRCRKMLERTNSVAYALGSGNSIPTYVPVQNFLAMVDVVTDFENSNT